MNTRYTRNCTLTELQCGRPGQSMPYKKSTNNLQLAKQTETKKENKTHENDTHTFCAGKKRRKEVRRWREREEWRTFYDQCELCMPKWVPLIIYIRRPFSVRFSAEIRLFIGQMSEKPINIIRSEIHCIRSPSVLGAFLLLAANSYTTYALRRTNTRRHIRSFIHDSRKRIFWKRPLKHWMNVFDLLFCVFFFFCWNWFSNSSF